MRISNLCGRVGLHALGIPGGFCLAFLASSALAGESMVFDITVAFPSTVKAEGPPVMEPGSPSPGRIKPVGVSEDGFNPVASGFGLSIKNARFDIRPAQVSVFHNGRLVPDDDLTVSNSLIDLPAILQSGRNVVEILGSDGENRMLDARFVFWAGSHRLQGMVVDRDGQSVPNAQLTLILTEAPRVTANGRSGGAGEFEFDHLPPNAVHIKGRAEPDLFGSVPASGNDGTARLVLFDILSPMEIENDNFSLGFSGPEGQSRNSL